MRQLIASASANGSTETSCLARQDLLRVLQLLRDYPRLVVPEVTADIVNAYLTGFCEAHRIDVARFQSWVQAELGHSSSMNPQWFQGVFETCRGRQSSAGDEEVVIRDAVELMFDWASQTECVR